MSWRYYSVLLITLVTYFIASVYVFDRVYESLHIVIDELFHIPQALAYCHRDFSSWDSKITTLPGLYFVSAAFLGSYFDCNTYNLRFVNLIASCINFILLSSILQYVYSGNTYLKTVLQALNLALLPPLYFYSHVYYTDTLSLMFLLAYSRLCFVNKYKMLILVFGLGSVLMRQTNIVWIAMVFGHKALDIAIKSSRVFGNNYLSPTLSRQSIISQDMDKSKLKRYYGLSDVFIATKYHISTCFTTFFKFLTFQDGLILLIHSVILVSFIAFVFINGSIVLGDKQAHEASIHIPQLFYFLIFYGVFGLPYVVMTIPKTLGLIRRNLTLVLILSIMFLVIVHYNTVVHPYLLADNRHYTFYIWNRWYGKYEFAKYATVPVYIFLLFSLYSNLNNHNCISFLLPYCVSVFLVLSLQKMIEIRYFLIPYIIIRLRFSRPTLYIVLCEFMWYVVLNVVTFSIFFNKSIVWRDFDYVQRIIW